MPKRVTLSQMYPFAPWEPKPINRNYLKYNYCKTIFDSILQDDKEVWGMRHAIGRLERNLLWRKKQETSVRKIIHHYK